MKPNPLAGPDRRIRSLRPVKLAVDAWRPLDVMVERERSAEGRLASTVTIFLAGCECPFTCVFCDLWRYTLDEVTPPGSLSTQIGVALEGLAESGEEATAVKLYNASNFFDPRAVPDEDIEEIARSVAGFESVTVESHPLLVGRRCARLGVLLGGRLEVAMGLETVHPRVFPRLNKRMRVEDFDRAAERLIEQGVGIRAFVLVGVPFLAPGEQVEWALRSVEHAVAHGATRVSLIPVRGGNGEMERLAASGDWSPPELEQLELALEASVSTPGVSMTADTWDLGRLASCESCREHRVSRLEHMNLVGKIPARQRCGRCGWG